MRTMCVFYRLTSAPRETSVFDDERRRPERIGEPHSFSVRVENLADYTGIRGALSPLPSSPGGSIHAAHEFVPLASRARKRVNYRRESRYTVYRGIPSCFFTSTARPAQRKRMPRAQSARCASHAVTARCARTGAQVRAHEAITCLRCSIIDDKALTPARRQRRLDT